MRLPWGALAIGFNVMFLSSSLKGIYQIYFKDLAAGFSLGTGHFALSGAVFGLLLGILSPVVGMICDKKGANYVLITGAIAAMVAFFLMSYTENYGLFFIGYAVVGAYAAAALTFVPVGMLIDCFFQQKKGLAFAVVSNGTALGFIVLSPLWVWLHNWLQFKILAIGMVIVFLVLVLLPLLFWKKISDTNTNRKNVSDTELFNLNGASIARIIKTPAFFWLAVGFSGCGASMLFIDMYFVPLMQDIFYQLPANIIQRNISFSLSLLGIMELIGAIWIGWIIQIRSAGWLLCLLYGIRSAAMLSLLFINQGWGFILFSCVFGLSYMGTVIVTSLICLEYYGIHEKGKAFGLLFLIHQISVFAVAWAGGILYDFFQNYNYIIIMVMVMTIISSLSGLKLQQVIRQSLIIEK
ncbi:MFS transporter [Stenoxybacter acetivorans]|uniref:MFS transporter n=1 Tax=Stenoxybacter acetivorans TaxID=422441 RepID=UPI00055FC7AE|nr:MFS transporter [Stenoxybacter acetivorans]